MKATQQLKDEHEGIKLMLNITEKIANDLIEGKPLNTIHYDQIIAFIKDFADVYHQGKEEDILYPAMVKRGVPKESGPLAVMLDEHELGKMHIKSLTNVFETYKKGNKKEIQKIISCSMGYVEYLRNHIEKENNVLLWLAQTVLNKADQIRIFDAFEKVEIKKTGIGKKEEYHQIINNLNSIYLQ